MEGNPTISIPTTSVPTSTSSPTHKKSFSELLHSNPRSQSSPPAATLLPPSLHHGEPALKFPQSLVDQLASPFKFTLVGKFSHGRPTMDRARSVFARLD